jgi:regulatory protein
VTSRKRKSPPAPPEPLDARATRVTALDALARRDHSSADLRRKLLARGFDADLVGSVLNGLAAERLVDDNRYVENFVGSRARRGHGPNRVRADLLRAGLAGALVEEALCAYPDWLVQLQTARRKRFGSKPAAGNAAKLREIRFLGYRGFTSDQIRLALGFDTDIESEDESL